MGGPVVRLASTGDVPVVHRLVLDLAEHEGEATHVAATPDSLAAAIAAEPPRACFLLAETDGHVVGYLSWTRPYGIWRGGDYLNLDDLYVAEQSRGSGVGEALMRAFAARAVEAGLAARWEVKPDNEGARRFYARLGADLADKTIVRWSLATMAAI